MIKKSIGLYTIIIGISMVLMWTMLYLTDGIPELETEPMSIIMHMIAEYITGIVLVVAGYGLFTNKKWGYNVYLLSTGALIYTLIQSSGYYLQQGVIGFVVMFAVFFVLTILSLISILINNMN